MSSSLASFLQMLFNGLSLGATLALIAVGLTMVFGVLRVVNFSHGVLFMFGAYTTYFVVEVLGQGYFTALVVAAVVVASISAALGATVFRRFEGLLLEGAIAGILLALLLENVALVWFGASPKSVAGPFTDVVAIGGVYLEGHRILIIAVAIVLVTALHLFVTRTRYGRALRAAQQDSFAARSQGIAVPRMLIMTFAIGGALAGAAGALVAPQQVLLPRWGSRPSSWHSSSSSSAAWAASREVSSPRGRSDCCKAGFRRTGSPRPPCGAASLSPSASWPSAPRECSEMPNSARLSRSGRPRQWGKISAALGLLAGITFGLTAGEYYLNVGVLAFLSLIMAISLRLLMLAGEAALCHGAFYAFGAYTTGILTTQHGMPFWLTVSLGGLVAACGA